MPNTENSRDMRFRAIETLLLWEGEVDNSRLRSLLGVQNVQASRILAEYAAHNAHQIYRPSPRAPYQASATIKPSFSSGTIEEYLALVQKTEDLDQIIEDARIDLTAPMPSIFSAVLQACRRSCGLNIQYRSMTTPQGRNRLIYPHTIVRAGRRWHARAWCTERKDFRDFVIGRMQTASIDTIKSERTKGEDAAWNKKLPLILAAHPDLDADRTSIINDEYFSSTTSRQLLVRSCLLLYVVQDLKAATNPATECPPEFQLVVANAKDLQLYLLQQPAG
ncbi:MAG: WYL domain-containing protein [Burkholderiales bacterium]|jgi:hypothetical protein|nr:WYL domain-containing protein [Burkholderiales bacterium]